MTNPGPNPHYVVEPTSPDTVSKIDSDVVTAFVRALGFDPREVTQVTIRPFHVDVDTSGHASRIPIEWTQS